MWVCGVLGVVWGDLWVLSSVSQYSKVLVIWFWMHIYVIKKVKDEFKVI